MAGFVQPLTNLNPSLLTQIPLTIGGLAPTRRLNYVSPSALSAPHQRRRCHALHSYPASPSTLHALAQPPSAASTGSSRSYADLNFSASPSAGVSTRRSANFELTWATEYVMRFEFLPRPTTWPTPTPSTSTARVSAHRGHPLRPSRLRTTLLSTNHAATTSRVLGDAAGVAVHLRPTPISPSHYTPHPCPAFASISRTCAHPHHAPRAPSRDLYPTNARVCSQRAGSDNKRPDVWQDGQRRAFALQPVPCALQAMGRCVLCFSHHARNLHPSRVVVTFVSTTAGTTLSPRAGQYRVEQRASVEHADPYIDEHHLRRVALPMNTLLERSDGADRIMIPHIGASDYGYGVPYNK
ncbi:hypothetical protein B0H19DRAFT_1086436 [Mycena capillaripes]|nr:hypothetical protein B0H19DRAFT_1086436 [Mycena capillaripes]